MIYYYYPFINTQLRSIILSEYQEYIIYRGDRRPPLSFTGKLFHEIKEEPIERDGFLLQLFVTQGGKYVLHTKDSYSTIPSARVFEKLEELPSILGYDDVFCRLYEELNIPYLELVA